MIRGIIFPTQDRMGRWGDGAGDLGEVGVHRVGVGEGQHEARRHGASWANRSEDVGPLVSRVALGLGSGAAFGPDAGEGALLANPRVRRENPPPDGFLVRLTLGTISPAACPVPVRGLPPLPPRGSFFERRLGLRVRLRVLRAHRKSPKPQRCQLLADAALLQGNAERGSDAGLQIAPPPAHHTGALPVGTRLDRRPQAWPVARGSAAGGAASPCGSSARPTPLHCSDAPVRRENCPPDSFLIRLTPASAGPSRRSWPPPHGHSPSRSNRWRDDGSSSSTSAIASIRRDARASFVLVAAERSSDAVSSTRVIAIAIPASCP